MSQKVAYNTLKVLDHSKKNRPELCVLNLRFFVKLEAVDGFKPTTYLFPFSENCKAHTLQMRVCTAWAVIKHLKTFKFKTFFLLVPLFGLSPWGLRGGFYSFSDFFEISIIYWSDFNPSAHTVSHKLNRATLTIKVSCLWETLKQGHTCS